MSQPAPKHIFIVDDDIIVTESLRDYLTRTVPHHVTTFSSGEECLKHIHEDPDVVILDYYLDTVDKNAANGMQILEQLKKQKPGINVIMLSSQEHYGVAMKTIIKGAEQYVIKDKDAYEKIAKMVGEME